MAVATAERVVATPADRAFAAWTRADLVARWMFDPTRDAIVRVVADARIGGPFSYVVRRGADEIDHLGAYVAFDPPNRLGFTWAARSTSDTKAPDESRVAVAFTPDGAGTRVSVEHELHPAWAHMAAQIAGSWRKMLDRLASAAERGAV